VKKKKALFASTAGTAPDFLGRKRENLKLSTLNVQKNMS
jgi:hypothetical protein